MDIVLDEFHWLANYRQELFSTLKMVWEQYLSRAPSRSLILCGSIAFFMTTKVIRSSTFYGRADLMIHLQGFTFMKRHVCCVAVVLRSCWMLHRILMEYRHALERAWSSVVGWNTSAIAISTSGAQGVRRHSKPMNDYYLNRINMGRKVFACLDDEAHEPLWQNVPPLRLTAVVGEARVMLAGLETLAQQQGHATTPLMSWECWWCAATGQ